VKAHTAGPLVVAAALIASSPAQRQDVITDMDAYRIYAVLVPQAWARYSTGTLLLQRETEVETRCRVSRTPEDADWLAAEESFRQENARVRLLEPKLPLELPYRLIDRAEIEADDARLAKQYPGIWQRRPGSLEYVAVSAVGFNPARTKAIVYVRVRSSGTVRSMERRGGAWVESERGGCGWIA
jgi:hypothetical protein